MKNRILLLSSLLLILMLNTQCGVKDAIDDTALSVRCANLVVALDERTDNNPDRSCDEVIADIDEIERVCGDIISESNREQFNELREACAAAN
ncbi:hypothetical protein [Maribacter sp. 2210JD10-5]|uniref:hypothetical protein n=1 Tax=Maribacter sp. 2210JD10-5 TaxID=3386272 RepID=UPI0039BCFEE3